MASYLSRVRAITGSTTVITSDVEVVGFLKSGGNYVVNNIPKELLFFAYTNTNVSSSAGVVVPQNTIISVNRGSYDADRIDSKYGYARSSTLTSLYKATAFHPSYIVDNGKVYIDPTPTTATSSLGTVTYIKMPTIGTTTSSTNLTIAPVENPIILYAAALDCTAISTYWGQLTTGAQDALDKAQYLIDSSSNLTNGQDAEYHMNDEDSELVSMNVQVASQEVNRATANISMYSNKAQLADSKSKELFARADAEVKGYIAANTGAYYQGDKNNGVKN